MARNTTYLVSGYKYGLPSLKVCMGFNLMGETHMWLAGVPIVLHGNPFLRSSYEYPDFFSLKVGDGENSQNDLLEKMLVA